MSSEDLKFYDIQKFAWESDIKPAGRKFVLVCLAFHSDNFGSCFPHVGTIAAETGQGKSTVKEHLKQLEALGLIRRERQRYENGYLAGYRYFINVRNLDLGKSPRSEKPESYVRNLDDNNNQLTTSKTTKSASGKRLPDDWRPPEGMTELYNSRQLNREDVRFEYDKFKDHWASASGANARKRDWNAAWRNWIRRAQPNQNKITSKRNSHDRPQRNRPETNGQRKSRIADEALASVLSGIESGGPISGFG